jgi:hypothetical protein
MMRGMTYEIRVREQLQDHWSEWFDGLSLVPGPDSSTVLVGSVVDSAALFGLLDRVRDLGLTLLSVHAVEPD